MISHHSASLEAVNSSIGTPRSAARSMILSSMSVMLETYVTSRPLNRRYRRSTSNTSENRPCPRWGTPSTVGPHT